MEQKKSIIEVRIELESRRRRLELMKELQKQVSIPIKGKEECKTKI